MRFYFEKMFFFFDFPMKPARKWLLINNWNKMFDKFDQ